MMRREISLGPVARRKWVDCGELETGVSRSSLALEEPPRPVAFHQIDLPMDTAAGGIHPSQLSLHLGNLGRMLILVLAGVGLAQPGSEFLALDPAAQAGIKRQEHPCQ